MEREKIRFFREVHVSARNSRGGFRSVIARSAFGLRQFFAALEGGRGNGERHPDLQATPAPQSGGEPQQSQSGLRPPNEASAAFSAKRFWTAAILCRSGGGRRNVNRHPDLQTTPSPKSCGEPPQSQSGLRPRNEASAAFSAKRFWTAAILCRSGGGRWNVERHPDLQATPAPKAVEDHSSPRAGCTRGSLRAAFFLKRPRI